jgi:hypothetical protein
MTIDHGVQQAQSALEAGKELALEATAQLAATAGEAKEQVSKVVGRARRQVKSFARTRGWWSDRRGVARVRRPLLVAVAVAVAGFVVWRLARRDSAAISDHQGTPREAPEDAGAMNGRQQFASAGQPGR